MDSVLALPKGNSAKVNTTGRQVFDGRVGHTCLGRTKSEEMLYEDIHDLHIARWLH